MPPSSKLYKSPRRREVHQIESITARPEKARIDRLIYTEDAWGHRRAHADVSEEDDDLHPQLDIQPGDKGRDPTRNAGRGNENADAELLALRRPTLRAAIRHCPSQMLRSPRATRSARHVLLGQAPRKDLGARAQLPRRDGARLVGAPPRLTDSLHHPRRVHSVRPAPAAAGFAARPESPRPGRAVAFLRPRSPRREAQAPTLRRG